jgi:proteic killer suppression protein
MIKSTKGKMIDKLIAGGSVKGFPSDIIRRAELKITMLDAATSLEDLKIPPSNHLEKLTHDRSGQYSIRINQQWRICFIWEDKDAYEVEIVDYH